jgi:AraC-like DNA-binding protein
MEPTPFTLDQRCMVHDWLTLRAQVIFVFDSPLPNGATNGTYLRHNELSAWLVRRGWARLTCGGRTVEARPGQWLVCTGAEIRQELSDDVHILSVRLHHDWPNGRQLFEGGPLCLFEAADYPRLETIARELIREFGSIDWAAGERSYSFLWRTRIDYHAFLRQQRHLLQWLEELSGALLAGGWRLEIPGAVDSRLGQALHVIDYQHPGEPFRAEALVQASGLTLGHLNRIAKESLGLTLHDYYEQRRLEFAKLALSEERASVKAVASSLGFTQLSHFSAWFKRRAGAAPRAYLRRQRP